MEIYPFKWGCSLENVEKSGKCPKVCVSGVGVGGVSAKKKAPIQNVLYFEMRGGAETDLQNFPKFK